MLNKKLLFGFAALALLPMLYTPANASDSTMEDDGASDTVYLRFGYNPAYVGENIIEGTKNITLTGTAGSETAVAGTKDYKPDYKVNIAGGSVGVGKSFDGEARAEFEIAAQYNVKVDGLKNESYFDNINEITGVSPNTTSKPAGYVNKGFSYGAAFVSAYYDVDYVKNGVRPYFGGGLGIARVEFLSDPTKEAIAYPIALQLKAGVSMKMEDLPTVYVGYKLVHLMNKEWDDKIAIKYKTAATPTATDTTIKASYTLHNLDIGFMLTK